jgi:hypothetical protein
MLIEKTQNVRYISQGSGNVYWIKFISFCLLFAIIAGLPRAGLASVYYVDQDNPDANDSNPGAEAQPWKTLTKAAGTAQAGDTVLVKAGIYNETLRPINSGTPGAMITFKAYPGQAAVIDGRGASANGVEFSYGGGRNYIRVDGFEVKEWGLNGAYLGGGVEGIEIVDCNIHDNGANGMSCGMTGSPATNIRISGNTIHNNWDDAIKPVVEQSIIENNQIGPSGNPHNDPHSDGIQIEHMADTVIRNNILCGYGQLIYISLYEPVGYFENVDIYGNVFYSTTEYAYGPGSNPANPYTWWTAPAVFIFCNPDLPGRYVNNINIHSNTFLWTGLPGILVIRHSGDHPITNITILNNVFFDSDVSTSGVDPAEVSSNYNLFFDSPEFGTATPWINEGPSSIIQQDPQFVNYERFVSWDFRLEPTSPAIDAGAPDLAALFNLPTPFLDLDGNTRPFDVPGVGRDGSGAFDIGAHEYGSVPPGGGYILSININGNGSVTRQPDESTYSSGTVVTLVGAPDSGNTFDSWGGALSGSDNPTTITMDSYKTVTANFQEIDVTPPSIVSVSTSQDSVEILFDESLDPCSAVDTSNYTIVDDGNNSIAISSALLHSGDTRVTLSTAAHTENTTYTLAVTDVNDPAGNSMSRTTEQYQYTPINIDANLVGYWKFDDGGGSTAADASVNGNTGTLINGPVWETNTSRIGGAVRLDGGDDAVEIGTANLSVNSGTITLWAYAESFSNTHHFLFGLANQPFSNRVQLYTDDAEGYLDLGLGDSHARHTNIENLDTQTWYHIALTWDGSNYLVYVNAVPKANGTYTGLSTLETYADIGNNGYSAGRNEAFGGNIDEVRIYNRALSADEILVLFNEAPVLMFSPIGDKVVDEGPTLMFDINTVDSNVVVDINDHNLPSEPNFFLNGGDWTFSWTPTYDDAGIYNVTFIATKGEIEDLETIVITVNNVNRAPILATIGSRTVSENEALNFTVSAIDPDGDSVTYSAQNLPAGATLSGDTFNWTPTSAGTYNVTFIASDGQLDDPETITITVTSSGSGSITDSLVGYWKLNDNAANPSEILLICTLLAKSPELLTSLAQII